MEEDEGSEIEERAWDDVKGGYLDLDKVREARRVEMGFVRDRRVYKKSSIEEALRVTRQEAYQYWLGGHR